MIAKALINPALATAKVYKRSVGFFSSGSLSVLIEGIIALVRNNGKICLIASPKLSEADIQTVKKGYSIRKKLLEELKLVKHLKIILYHILYRTCNDYPSEGEYIYYWYIDGKSILTKCE